MYQFIAFLSFIFSSTNQHGVHSPFVYDYVTNCLYKKSRLRLSITQKILVKSISYFDYKTIRLLTGSKSLEQSIKKNFPAVTVVISKADVVFGSIQSLQSDQIDVHLLENGTMLLVDRIHKNKNNFEQWERLKNHKNVRVTLDLFYCGVIFFRKEQAKEHFKIRI